MPPSPPSSLESAGRVESSGSPPGNRAGARLEWLRPPWPSSQLPRLREWGTPSTGAPRSMREAAFATIFDLDFIAGDAPQIAPSAEAAWDLYATSVGPMKALADSLPPERHEALRQAFI